MNCRIKRRVWKNTECAMIYEKRCALSMKYVTKSKSIILPKTNFQEFRSIKKILLF